jgi:hypothetical protein
LSTSAISSAVSTACAAATTAATAPWRWSFRNNHRAGDCRVVEFNRRELVARRGRNGGAEEHHSKGSDHGILLASM